jgi:hypothetical protein
MCLIHIVYNTCGKLTKYNSIVYILSSLSLSLSLSLFLSPWSAQSPLDDALSCAREHNILLFLRAFVETKTKILILLLHLQGDRARSLSDRERSTLSSRVESLHGTRTVRVALRNVQLRLVHAQVVLRVTRGGEQRR